MSSLLDSVREGIMFLGYPSATFVCLFVCVGLDRYCYHNISQTPEQFNKTGQEYSLATADDLIRFWRSKIKVTAGSQGDKSVHVNAGDQSPIL